MKIKQLEWIPKVDRKPFHIYTSDTLFGQYKFTEKILSESEHVFDLVCVPWASYAMKGEYPSLKEVKEAAQRDFNSHLDKLFSFLSAKNFKWEPFSRGDDLDYVLDTPAGRFVIVQHGNNKFMPSFFMNDADWGGKQLVPTKRPSDSLEEAKNWYIAECKARLITYIED